MLCIRISEQEYEGLKSVCEARGSRSISDLAREAVSRLIDGPVGGDAPEWVRRVDQIDTKVEALKHQIRRLERLVALPTDSPNFAQGDLRALEAANGD